MVATSLFSVSRLPVALRITALSIAVVVLFGGEVFAREPLSDVPVAWYENDRNHIAKPEPRYPNLAWDQAKDAVLLPRQRMFNPVRGLRKLSVPFGGDPVLPAANVNAFDEVLNSSWFTNRIGMHSLTPAQVAKGPGEGVGPDRSQPWKVVSAKTQGVTPGFNITDATGQVYVIKFDPPGYLGMTSAAAVISNLLLYACGYNTPEDFVVTFSRDDLVLGSDTQVRDINGKKRAMTDADLDAILARVDKLPDGRYLSIASKFLAGEYMGPFNYYGRRDDDPNDTFDHEHRRELRGLMIIASWINHYDTKQHNSLDMYVTENGRSFVRHYLIDFASTLGTGARGPVPKYGYEYTIDWSAKLARTFTLGLREDPWRNQAPPPGLEREVGFFVSDIYEPHKFNPLQTNTAFANATNRDGYWAAKIVGAFTDEHLRAIVAKGGYRLQGSAEYMARVLGERRDKITREYFDRIAPLDFFVWQGEAVTFSDLGQKYHTYPGTTPRYEARLFTASADRDRHNQGRWHELAQCVIPADILNETLASASDKFVGIDLRVDRGEGWSAPVTVYLSPRTRKVIAVDR